MRKITLFHVTSLLSIERYAIVKIYFIFFSDRFGMKALVSIVVDPARLSEVCTRLAELEEITKVYEITGEYDVLVEVIAESIEEFRKILNKKILGIKGVKLTESAIVLGEWK